MARKKKSTRHGNRRLEASSPGERLAYDNTRQERRKKSKRKKKKSKLQKVHMKFMKKKLRQLNRRGGKPQTNMKKAARAWKKSPERKKALRKSRRKK